MLTLLGVDCSKSSSIPLAELHGQCKESSYSVKLPDLTSLYNTLLIVRSDLMYKLAKTAQVTMYAREAETIATLLGCYSTEPTHKIIENIFDGKVKFDCAPSSGTKQSYPLVSEEPDILCTNYRCHVVYYCDRVNFVFSQVH